MRWNDHHPITGERDWRLGIMDMVSSGISRVQAGAYDGLRFDCMNREEVSLVDELMRKHPEIPYGTTYVSFKGDGIGDVI